MKQKTKKILLFSLGLAGAGIILMGAGMLIGGIPGVRISKDGITSPYREAQYIQEKTMMGNYVTIHDIDIDIDSDAEIILRPSSDNSYHAEYVLNGAYGKPVCEVTDHVLRIRQKQNGSLVAMDLSFLFGKLPEEKLILYIPGKNELNTVSICHQGTLQMTDINWLWLNELHLKNDGIELTATAVKGQGHSYEPLTLTMEPGWLTADNLYADTFLLSAEHSTCKLTNLHCKEETSFKLDSCDMLLSDVSFSRLFQFDNCYGSSCFTRFDFDDAAFTLDNASLDLIGGEVCSLDCQISYGTLNLTMPDVTSFYNFDVQTQHGTITFPGMEHKISSVDADTQTCQIKSLNERMLNVKVQGDDADINIAEGGERGPREPLEEFNLPDYYYSDIYNELSDYIESHHPEPDEHHPDEHH